MHARVIIVTAVVFIACSLATRAHGDGEAEAVAKGIALYEDLEYEAAVKVLGEALAAKGLPLESKKAGLVHLALAQAALGEENAARDSFRRLLEIDRGFKLAKTASPSARALLEDVRLDLPGQVSLEERRPPQGGRASSPVILSIAVVDPSKLVSGVVVHFRADDKKAFSTVAATPVNKSGDYAATIPGAFVTTGTLSYYITAQAARGVTVASLGDIDKPLTLGVAAAAKSGSKSVLRSPWLWAGVGAAAIGGGVAAFFLLRDDPANGFINIIPE